MQPETVESIIKGKVFGYQDFQKAIEVEGLLLLFCKSIEDEDFVENLISEIQRVKRQRYEGEAIPIRKVNDD